jgi:hypothetical protein
MRYLNLALSIFFVLLILVLLMIGLAALSGFSL